MLDNIELMFTDLELMLRKLKKLSYEENMKRFRSEQGHFIEEMISAHINNNSTRITTLYCLLNLIKLIHIIVFDNK